jgi:hypothetical protein
MPKKKRNNVSPAEAAAEAEKRALIRRANKTEKPEVEVLLKLLCDTIPDREYAGIGAKPIQLRDIVYCMIYKVYTLWATERSGSSFDELLKKGYITCKPSSSCVFQFFNEESLCLLLDTLIGRSSKPLILCDCAYPVDSTHFPQPGYLPYRFQYPEAYTVKKAKGRKYLRLHVMVGADTLIITSAIPGSMNAPERDFFRPLLERTIKLRAEAARVKYPGLPEEVERELERELKGKPLEVLGDKGYTGRKVKEVAREYGITLTVTEKRNSRDKEKQLELAETTERLRNSIETVFSMMKAKLGSEVRCKNKNFLI